MNRLRRLVCALSADRVAAILLFIVFAVYGIVGSGIAPALESDIVGPGFFPSIIGTLGAGLALAMLLKSSPESKAAVLDVDLVALVPAGLLLAYVLALQYAGFPLATVAFLTVTFKYLGCPGWRRSAVYAFLSTAALIGVFHYGLELTLPHSELVRML